MTKKPEPEPFHPPVGVAGEVYRTSRRWIALAVLVLAVLAASAYAFTRL